MSLIAEWDGICSIEINGPRSEELPEHTWIVLDLMLRELTANSVRSGKSNLVQVEIRHEAAHRLRITIHDNGVGMSHVTPGLGTAWMNIVAEDISISPSPSGGTTLTLQLPLINSVTQESTLLETLNQGNG